MLSLISRWWNRGGVEKGADEHRSEAGNPASLQNPGGGTSGHVYSVVNISGNARAILGNVEMLDLAFFNRTDSGDRQQLILRSLFYNGMRTRKEQVDQNSGSPRSIAWVWSTSLPVWLQNSDGIFWISGSPGSGKSVLMKHLADSAKTKEMLKTSRDDGIVLHFFFDFRAGSTLPNRTEGMLRSLLHQLVKRRADVALLVDENLFGPPRTKVSMQQYIDSICDAVNALPAKVCAFIDGLDECQGSSNELLEVLDTLRDRSSIRLCLASRPETRFEKSFSQYPRLQVQDHNDESICFYIDTAWQALRLGDPNLPLLQLTDRIRKAAKGVFLWARLAVDDVVQRLLNGQSISELQEHIDKMPLAVEEMYRRYLDALPTMQRTEAAMILHTLVSANGPCELRKLYVCLTTALERLNLKDVILPVDVDGDNTSRVIAILGAVLDTGELTPIEKLGKLEYRPKAEELPEPGSLRVAPWRLRGHSLFFNWGEPTNVTLLHETLHSFFLRSDWISKNLPPAFKAAYSANFLMKLYAEEVDACPVVPAAKAAELVGRVKDYTADARHLESSLAEEMILEILFEWPYWTRLLPIALTEFCDQVQEQDLRGKEEIAAVRKVLTAQVFVLHCALCFYASRWEYYYVETVHQSRLSSCRHLSTKPCMRELFGNPSSSEADLVLAICHGIPHIVHEKLQSDSALNLSQVQNMFDAVFEKYVDAGQESFKACMDILLDRGAKLDSRHLCYALLSEYAQGDGLFVCNLFEQHISDASLQAHHSCCKRRRRGDEEETAQSHFIRHWARYRTRETLCYERLLRVILDHTESMDAKSTAWKNALAVILDPYQDYIREYGPDLGRVSKFLAMVKYGLDLELASDSVKKGLAELVAARKRIDNEHVAWHSQKADIDEIAEILDYCQANGGKLPQS